MLGGDSMPVRTTKELMRDAVENLPPDATVEEAMERLYLLAKIEHGLEQEEAGETVTHEEVRHRLSL
jgi:predicted transcriptional regulator